MNNIVYKYDLNVGTQNIQLPRDARPISVGEQNGKLVLWAEVNHGEKDMIFRPFVVLGTGWGFPFDMANYKFLGTVQKADGTVWHAYYR